MTSEAARIASFSSPKAALALASGQPSQASANPSSVKGETVMNEARVQRVMKILQQLECRTK